MTKHGKLGNRPQRDILRHVPARIESGKIDGENMGYIDARRQSIKKPDSAEWRIDNALRKKELIIP
jgi:hypothetical protein